MFFIRRPIMYFYIWKFFSSLETCDTSASNFCKEGIFGYFQEDSTSGGRNPSTCERERVFNVLYWRSSSLDSSYGVCIRLLLFPRFHSPDDKWGFISRGLMGFDFDNKMMFPYCTWLRHFETWWLNCIHLWWHDTSHVYVSSLHERQDSLLAWYHFDYMKNKYSTMPRSPTIRG